MSTYKALELKKTYKSVSDALDDGLHLVNVTRKPLKPTQVRIKIYASALNFYDLLILINQYQHKPKLPYITGSEGSGVVIEVGEKVKNFKVGDEVMMAMSFDGVNGEEVVTEEMPCMKKPKSFSFAEAAAFPVGYFTAYHGLVQRGNLKKGDFLLVTGAGGGMGLSAVQLGKALGAKVIAGCSSAEKLEHAKKGGADYLIDYSKEDLKKRVEEITKGKNIDVCYEVVGGDIFSKCIRVMGSGGRLLVVGFASGKIPQIPANLVLVKGFQVVGVRSGAEMQANPAVTAEMKQILPSLTKGRDLAPVIYKYYKPDQFVDAYKAIHERKVVGKAVFTWREGADKVPAPDSKL